MFEIKLVDQRQVCTECTNFQGTRWSLFRVVLKRYQGLTSWRLFYVFGDI